MSKLGAAPDGAIMPGQLVKVLSAGWRGKARDDPRVVRLDIGVASFRRNTAGTHDSWATRLVLRRLDGANKGDVMEGHVFGIFSEDGRKRLDLGCASIEEQRDVRHESWATRLRIRPLKEDTDATRPLQYNEVVGVFSDDGRSYRLDIGSAACKEQHAEHDSWATRLRLEAIEANDGVVGYPPSVAGAPGRNIARCCIVS